jgi:hypothetical protein
MAGVRSLQGHSDGASALWRAMNANPSRVVLRLGAERSTGIDAAWQLPRAEGQVLLIASGTVLANRNIGAADARHFVANLVRHHVAPDGAVIFDDMHQGLSDLYDPAALFRDPRLGYTVALVLAAWLLYLLGSSNRFGPPLAEHSAPRQKDFLAAAGGFMARRLEPRAAALLLLDEWFDDVRRARGLPARGDPPWQALEATPALSRRTFDELRRAHEILRNGRTVDLVRLHNTLKQAREAIG